MNGTNHEREEHIMTQHDITDDDLITINEGYELLPPGVITLHTFRQWAVNGKIPAQRLGHKLVVRRGDVLALLQPVDAA
jgi:hypothetical protein